VEQLIPKPELFRLLHKEAPDFIRAILSIELPRSNSRLNVPTIDTYDKRDAAEANMSEVEKFIKDKCFEVSGSFILFSEFYEKFIGNLDPSERQLWSKRKVTDRVPSRIPKGRRSNDVNVHLGNITMDCTATPGPKLFCDNNKFLRSKVD